MKKKSEKQKDLDNLKTELAKVSTVILTTFQGITVEDDTKLRRAVQAAGGKYQVVKNTLAQLAGSGTPAEGVLKNLKGTHSIAYTQTDPVALAKALTKIAKDVPAFQFKSGVVEGKVISIAEIKQLAEATELIKKTHHTKFNETVELAINLGVDPKHSDQVVRGTVVLPHGLGKSVRVLVLAGGEKQREATDAGAEFVGGDDMVQKIMEGWTDFDAVIATPDMMRSAGKLGKVLGPRGLMPNPKTGTVTIEVAKAVKETKAGKVEFRVDKAGIVHCPVGKINFEASKLAENAHAVIVAVVKAKPSAAKGKYVKRITLTSTMGPGIMVDPAEAETLATAA